MLFSLSLKIPMVRYPYLRRPDKNDKKFVRIFLYLRLETKERFDMFGMFGIVAFDRKKDSVWSFLDAREIHYVWF